MKINHQITIDQMVVKPLNQLLNLLVRLVGKLLRINHDLSLPFKRIAISKYKGMGSIIQATPLIQTLRLAYPDATITFVTTRANRSILLHLEAVDQVIILDDRSFWKLLFNFPRLIYKLFIRRFDLFIDLEVYSNTSSMITTLSAARNRIGYYLRDGDYRLGLYTHMLFLNTQVPISQAYLQMARLLKNHPLIPELYALSETPNTHDALVNEYPFLKKKSYIIINPNASDLRLERRWDPGNYQKIIHDLVVNHPEFSVVLIGASNEATYVNSILKGIKNSVGVFSMAGKTTVNELISMITHARFMITNDTGPMHIAFSVKTPVIGLFGPCSPHQYGQSPTSISIYFQTYCSPCVHDFEKPPCAGDNVCMQNITVNHVTNAIERVLKDDFDPVRTDPTFFESSSGEPCGIIHRS